MSKKTLYIARHAKSDWSDASLSDFERTLNPRGKKDAPFMAKLLKEKGIKPELILSSPATRAKETAKEYHSVLGGELRFNAHIYEASTLSLRYLVEETFQEVDTLMLVGHNPGLTGLNDLLSDKSIYNLVTAAVVAIEFDEEV
ncbi:MAG TPA: histidine phosphatase family protein, partial [Sulfurovum sp.]|nr:histidine phosphatase family protein [Sulfurovum sp.]